MAKRRALKLPKKIVKLKSGVRQSPDADPSLVQCRRPSSPRKYNEDQPRQPQQQGQSFKAMPTTGWWLDPAGTVHDVPGMVTHDEWIQQNMHKHPSLAGYQSPQDAEAESPFRDHAFAKGWQRLVHIPAGRSLIVENTKVKPNEKQLGAIADHASSLGSPKVEMYHPFERRSRMKEFLSRKGLPKRYAKVDGHEPAHHLVAGFPIEHALRHLANDPNNTSDVRDVAKAALTGKNALTGEDTDVSSALWVLNDALNESNHPLRSPSAGGHGYNWMSAADKIHLDSHVHTALTEEGERMRKEHNEPHTSARDWAYRPEGQALRIHRGMTNQNDYGTLNSRAIDAYNRVIARVKSLSKVDDEDMIKESIKRHASRAAMTWRKEHMVGVKDDFYGSTNPPVDPTDYHGPRASDPVTRYAAKGDRGYSWMTPGGKYHPVVGMDTHEKLIKKLGYKDINDAYADGWQRIIAMGNVLYSHNPVRAPNGTQKSQLIDHALEERHEAVIHDNSKTSRVLWDSQDRLSRKGKPKRMARTLPSKDKTLRTFWGQLFAKPPAAKKGVVGTKLDSNAAVPLTDYLMDNDDWRHHLTRTAAQVRNHKVPQSGDWQPGPYSYQPNRRRYAIRPDGVGSYAGDNTHNPVTHEMAYHVSDTNNPQPIYVYHDGREIPEESAYWSRDGVTHRGTPHAILGINHSGLAFSHMLWQHDDQGKPAIVVTTYHPTLKGGRNLTSVMTPEEYEAMRQDAATAGAKFPEAPESHRPSPKPEPNPNDPRFNKPIKKSLAVRGDFIDSLRRVKSANIETLNKVAQQVAKKLGLHPITSLPALHDTRHGSVPGIAQAVYGHATPEQIHTAAAWIGSVGNLPGVMVHHIRPNGPDTLYKFRQTGSGLDIRQKLDRAGLVDRVIAIPQGEPSRVGFDIMIADKDNKYRSAVAQYVKQNGLQVQSSQGYIKTVGSQDQAQARDQYRTQIARGERMARTGQPIKYAIPATWRRRKVCR